MLKSTHGEMMLTIQRPVIKEAMKKLKEYS